MIPDDGRQEPGRVAEWINRVLMALFRRAPKSVLLCAVCVAWDKATAEEFGEVWFENIPVMTLIERIEHKHERWAKNKAAQRRKKRPALSLTRRVVLETNERDMMTMNGQPTKNKIAEIKSLWGEYLSANDAVTNTTCVVNGTVTPDWLRAENRRVNIIDNLSDRAYSDTPQLLQYIDTLEADNAKMRAVLSALLGIQVVRALIRLTHRPDNV